MTEVPTQTEREAALEAALQKIAAPIGNEPLPGDHDYSPGKQVEFWLLLAIDYRRTAIRALKTTPAPAVSRDELERLVAHVRGGGPHEWGYRDLTDGTFIADDWPFDAANFLAAIARFGQETSNE